MEGSKLQLVCMHVIPIQLSPIVLDGKRGGHEREPGRGDRAVGGGEVRGGDDRDGGRVVGGGERE